MWPSLKPSQRVTLAGTIPPQSATTVQTSGWIDASQFETLLGVLSTGAITATGLIDAKFQQATSNAGAGVKDVTGTAITQLTAAANANNQVLVNLKADQLDTNNGFTFVRFSVTPSVAAALIAADVWGMDPKLLPGNALNPAAVVQIVN